MSTDLATMINTLGITVSSTYRAGHDVPDPRKGQLLWDITVAFRGREVLRTVFMAGVAHCPAYRKYVQRAEGKGVSTYDAWRVVAAELVTGVEHRYAPRAGMHDPKPIYTGEGTGYAARRTVPIKPCTADVVACLCGDAEVLDYASFSDWAHEMGLSDDSIKARDTYDVCMRHALALRSALGGAMFDQLRAAAAEY